MVKSHFNNPGSQGGLVGIGALSLVIAISGLIIGRYLGAAIYGVVGAFLILWAPRHFRVTVCEEDVITDVGVLIRRYAWEEISSASVGHGVTGMASGVRERFELNLVDGRVVVFGTLNARRNSDPEAENEVRMAVKSVNDQIALRASGW